MFSFRSPVFIPSQGWLTMSFRLILSAWGTRILLSKSTSSLLSPFYPTTR